MSRWAVFAGLIGLSLLAYVWPLFGVGVDPFVASKPWLTAIISLAMFCLGCLMPPDELRRVGQRWPTVLGGVSVQYITMPLLAWLLAVAFQIPEPLRSGVVLVGCVPGAMGSNVLTALARGNVSYSVSLTTLATLLSPLIVPWTLRLTAGADIDTSVFDGLATKLLLTVVLPVLIGHSLCRLSKPFAHIAEPAAGVIANVAILWIVAVVVGLNRERLGQATLGILAPLLLLNIAGYSAGWLGGRLLAIEARMRTALMLEVGMQNAGLGATLAVGLFPDRPEAAVPPALYTFGCMVTGVIVALGMRSIHERHSLHPPNVDAVDASAASTLSDSTSTPSPESRHDH